MSGDRQSEMVALPPEASGYDSWQGHHVEIRGWRDHFAVLLKHRWIIIIFAAIGAGWGYHAASRVILMYRATAVLRVSAGRQVAANLRGLVPGADGPDLETELELLRSRAMASVVVDSLHFMVRTDPAVWEVLTGTSVAQGSATVMLDFSRDFYAARDENGAEIVRVSYGRPMVLPNARLTAVRKPDGIGRAVVVLQDRASAIQRVRGGLRPSVRGGTQIVDLSFTDADPEVAAAVVNVAARVYQEQSRDNAQRRARARRSYISAQLELADSAHNAARMALLDFQRAIGVLGPRAQLEQWQVGLLGLEADRVKLVSDRQVLESILLGVNRDRVTDADLQALAYAPGMADNPMVQGHYTTYLSNKADRKFLTAGEFGEAETSPSVRRLDLLAESTKQELIKAAESVIGIMEMRIVAVQDYYVGQAQGRIGELPAEAAREAELTRRVLASQQVVEELSGELLRAGIAEVVEVGYVDIVDLAQVSNSPLRPGGPPKVMLGLLLGLAFGVAGAFGVHRVDTTVKDREDAEATLGISSLAVIPRTDTDKRLTHRVFGGLLNGRKPARSQVLLPAEGLAATPVAEAFRSLRTNLIFSQATSDLKSIVITSPMPGEGKTTTSGYLGAVFARQGARTLLIDSDLRKPRLHILFKSERSPGLTDVLLGEVELQAGVRKTEIDNLYLLPAGRGTSNPSELLGSKRLLRLAEAMRKEFDLVIWDSPPVLAFTDAAILGRAADGVILVLFAGTTERRAAQAASAQLRQSGAHMLGAVVNGFDPGGGIQYEYAYGYYSSYYYASQFTEGDS